MRKMSRREFLERSMWMAAAAAGAAFPVTRALADIVTRKRGPNGLVNLGVVGVKGRGLNHVEAYAGMKDVRIGAICDVDENVIGAAMKAAEKGSGKAPAYYKDFRKMLEDKSLDGVSIATCNHTHTLIAMSALAAGKHVYVEKPLSQNLREGAALTAAAKATGLVVQHGTQGRWSAGLNQMIAYLRSGELGALTAVRGFCYKRRTSIGKQPEAPVPKGVDYDLWLGPAPVRPFTRNRFHYNWHWNWDYGCGDIGNQGVHELDRARWGLGATTHPSRILSVGGRLGYEDDGQTPNTTITYYDYGSVPLLFEVRGLETDPYRGCRIGVIYDLKGGFVLNPDYETATVFDVNGKPIKTFGGGGDHFRGYIDAILANDPAKAVAPPAEGHLSASLCHLANVSYRTGQAAPLSGKPPFGNDVADEAFGRMRDHLVSQGLEAATTSYTRGSVIAFDGTAEAVPGNPKADALLTRVYRTPFTLPRIG